jgi:hypothetical protein
MKKVLILCALAAMAAANPFVHEFPASGTLTLVLQDRLDHPFYWWPKTLLNYRVHFAGRVRPQELALHEDGRPLPMQLSDVRLKDGYLDEAVVSFIADLQPGGSRQFELSRGTAPPATPGVKEERAGDAIVLDTGAVRVKLSTASDGGGPLRQFWRDGRWMGDSRLVTPGHKLTGVKAVREESGPVYVTYKVSYELSGGASYTAHIKAVTGYDWVNVREEMAGFTAAENAHVEMDWTGFHPTHREAPNHPYQQPNPAPGYARYNWEKIDEGNIATQHGVTTGIARDGEFPFRLGPYQPWGAYVMLTSANFWDERRNDAVGIFIDRIEDWQDHEYAIWASSNTLQVRYFYRDGLLSWRWPLVTGTRSTGIAVYNHAEDVQTMEKLDTLASKPFRYRDGQTYKANLSPISHTLFLQNRYGTIDLDLVKDWVLSYRDGDKHAPVIFQTGQISTPQELERRVFSSELIRDLANQGTRQNAGFAPVPSRNIYGWFIDGFDRLYGQMDERERQRLTAAYLLLSYTHGEEDYMPMKTMLAGHPNFLSDVKSAPALFTFLFPQHPMAQEWADEFEKFLELNTRYHTRPDVTAWDSHGGRWTENLGTYVWAFLRPALRANYVLSHYVDGKNRFAIPQVSELGDWLVNALSAPFNGEDLKSKMGPDGKLEMHDWGIVTPANGPRRLHPPQGAHSARRMPPRSMWLLGTLLRNYDPLVAEHMMWASRPTDQDAEEPATDPWRIMFNQPDNRGTNPHLESSKYTGYGLVLRAAVDTPEELSIHLEQIDEGPNYRWGIAGEGGCGVIYFYAGGKSYSHNGREDVGDRQAHDTDFSSNFGVWKNGTFRSVGRNGLEKPLDDLGVAQFAEIVPRQGANAYSWPEYQGRSILLASEDYFVVYDQVFSDSVAHRFSWFTQAQDEMPVIQMVKGLPRDRAAAVTEVQTSTTKGVWYDGMGDSMAVITHRHNLQIQGAKFGARVNGPGWNDLVFRNSQAVHFQEGDTAFEGRAGMVRKAADATTLAIFEGTRISADGVTLEPAADLAVSAVAGKDGALGGRFTSLKGGALAVTSRNTPAAAGFFVDGVKVAAEASGGVWKVTLPAGKHAWELTAGQPHPPAPHVLHTVNRSGETEVYFAAAGGASSYRAQLSRDNGATWTDAGTAAASPIRIASLKNGEKVHVRLIASNALHTSAPGPEYPVYVTDGAPDHPDGLRLRLGKDQVDLDWGEVLGVREYRLYRRVKGEQTFTLVYHGATTSFRDHAPGVVPAYAMPGMAANAGRATTPVRIYEYAVAAVNGNGEGSRSTTVDTSPESWRNWDPKPDEPFRRRFTYNTTNYMQVGQEEPGPRYYPH